MKSRGGKRQYARTSPQADRASAADVAIKVPSGFPVAGHNAVHLLARHRDAPWELAQRIVALGASAGCLGDPNPNGNTALHICSNHNNTWCAWALLDAGAGRDSKSVCAHGG